MSTAFTLMYVFVAIIILMCITSSLVYLYQVCHINTTFIKIFAARKKSVCGGDIIPLKTQVLPDTCVVQRLSHLTPSSKLLEENEYEVPQEIKSKQTGDYKKSDFVLLELKPNDHYTELNQTYKKDLPDVLVESSQTDFPPLPPYDVSYSPIDNYLSDY